MPNHFFRFKQFTVHQERSAMKVCTEACLFGAWLADIVRSGSLGEPRSMLDIGTGTGLLSLMLAQDTNALIDALEIEPMASREATSNFKISPWKNRLHSINNSVQKFSEGGNNYELVFSNPPFYSNDLQGPDEKRNLAHHDQSLSLEQLISCTDKLLKDDFYFAILIPFQRGKYFEELLVNYPFRIIKKTNIKQTSHHSFFRSMYLIRKSIAPVSFKEDIIVIKEGDAYSPEFIRLLKDYYLNLS